MNQDIKKLKIEINKNKKIKKKITIIILLILAILFETVIIVNKNKSKIKLITNDTDIVEYGENYSSNLYDILDFSNLSNDQVKNIL